MGSTSSRLIRHVRIVWYRDYSCLDFRLVSNIHTHTCIQNSVRHSLSFSQYFRKVAKQHGYQGQKGFDWEVVPEKQAALDKEVEKFLQAEGRSLIENPSTYNILGQEGYM